MNWIIIGSGDALASDFAPSHHLNKSRPKCQLDLWDQISTTFDQKAKTPNFNDIRSKSESTSLKKCQCLKKKHIFFRILWQIPKPQVKVKLASWWLSGFNHNTLRPEQNGRLIRAIFKGIIILNENNAFWLKFHRIVSMRIQLAMRQRYLT